MTEDKMGGDYKVGMVVRIIQDCRKEGRHESATGQTAIYEGIFPTGRGFDNLRFRLADGSAIWGYQCWWNQVKPDMDSLEAAQKRVEQVKARLRADVLAIRAMIDRLKRRIACYPTAREYRSRRYQREQVPLVKRGYKCR